MSAGVYGKTGKYLTFSLGREGYGIQIHKVREIISYMAITPVPKVPAHVRGIINLRGQVISVVDLRSKFSMPPIERIESSCIIVVQTVQADRTLNVGLIVDAVSDVLPVTDEMVADAPTFGPNVDMRFILGVAKTGDSVKLLLDIDKVLDASDIAPISMKAA
jgi:purine-binding chemotaxis protein CheW